ncbi:MAG TPA: MOSC domain-containing protein [Gemmatimonadales bacterium]|nr:MOSC domain-containing protein [Gemmatimonadales bacterium]
MKVLSICVGRPREVEWRGKTVLTSIFKTPISHRVQVGGENLEGDEQSDLTVHGGPEKAVYVYPAEHYPYWRRELPDAELPWGAFGENLTTEGLLEDEVWIGDRFRIGSAEFLVTQPRMPCYKLGVRFNRPDMVKRFHLSRRNGFYLAVGKPGEVGVGDVIERLARDERRLTVSDVVALYGTDDENQPLLERASEHPGLPESWREYFRQRRWGPDG